jgi:2-polyprenyl-6-methoxyphenol hydroxylase-like FAD-dependent oxidoreductase
MASESVAIVGAGLGGLALAQSLVSNGIECCVFERDVVFTAPGRSVRIHCRPVVDESMRSCLPDDVFDAFVASQGAPDARHVYLDGDLQVVAVDERPEAEIVLDTVTTREVLALGLGDRLKLGCEVASVSGSSGGRLTVVFTGGTSVEADVVVGADGSESTARRFAPDAPDVHDVALWSLYGTVDLDEHAELEIPAWLRDAFAIVVEGEVKVALGVYEPTGPAELRRHPSVHQRRYLFWNVLGRPETLQQLALAGIARLVGEASPWLADVVCCSSPGGVGRFQLQTSRRVGARDGLDGLVLLGDAAHPMLPAALSALVAVDDARRLGAALADPRCGTTLRERAVRAKEDMLEAAFARVHEAEFLAGPAFGLTGIGA